MIVLKRDIILMGLLSVLLIISVIYSLQLLFLTYMCGLFSGMVLLYIECHTDI